MVILQFNKMIRNKWIWGAFAVTICACFGLQDMFSGRNDSSEKRNGAGTLAGEEVDAKLFGDIAQEVRGLGRGGDWKADQADVNRQAWENLAALEVAAKLGLEATDDDIKQALAHDPSFQVDGVFSFDRYQTVLSLNGLTPTRYEASLKHSLTLQRVMRQVLGTAAWASPMELDQAVADMTDVYTVKVVTFVEKPEAAAAVQLDGEGKMVEEWYNNHVKNLELPERVKIRYVKFDATKPELLAKMQITENDLRDQYDGMDPYTVKGTNDVETALTFDQLSAEQKAKIENDLRKSAALDCLQTNLTFRAYAYVGDDNSSKLDEIAKEEGLAVETSDWFTLDGVHQEGFMKRPYQILPGAQSLVDVVSELDPQNADQRYGVVSSSSAVWLIEKAEVSEAHTPELAEAKGPIAPRVLKDAKADAFKKAVTDFVNDNKSAEKILAGVGATNLAFNASVSTNLTFAVADLKPGEIPEQNSVARAVSTLKKGEISEFTLTSAGRALVVLCEDRVPGDAAKAMILKTQIQGDVTMPALTAVSTEWAKWNLERLGYETTAISSVQKSESEGEESAE